MTRSISLLLVTAIGGQGHIIGRGNQQISPRVLRAIGLEHLRVVATKRKLATLEGRPLLVDSGDVALDDAFEPIADDVVVEEIVAEAPAADAAEGDAAN